MEFLYGLTKKKYYGHYTNNLKDGFGIFLWGDGHSYEGFWKSGRQDGNGIIKSNDSFKYCQWNNGKLIKTIEDENMQNNIQKMIEETKESPDYEQFSINIKRYEKKSRNFHLEQKLVEIIKIKKKIHNK